MQGDTPAKLRQIHYISSESTLTVRATMPSSQQQQQQQQQQQRRRRPKKPAASTNATSSVVPATPVAAADDEEEDETYAERHCVICCEPFEHCSFALLGPARALVLVSLFKNETCDCKQALGFPEHDATLLRFVVCMMCCVCLSDPLQRLAAVGPCNHPGVCSLCYLRLRKLMRERTCVLCKSAMEQVMVCQPAELKPFADFAIWGDDAGPEHVWDDDSRMFLPKQYHSGFVSRLEEFVCGHTTEEQQQHRTDVSQRQILTVLLSLAIQPRQSHQGSEQAPCACRFTGQPQLEAHLREKHSQHLCKVCLKFKKVFLLEQQRFSPQELEHHIRTGTQYC
eukprot:1143-Heterococcus_DN1.PRE.2